MQNIYDHAVVNGLEQVISSERFQPYLDEAKGNKHLAFELYAFNMRVSEALLTPLHMLEIAMRNRFNRVLSSAFGDDWFTHPSILLPKTQQEQLKKARDDILQDGKEVKEGWYPLSHLASGQAFYLPNLIIFGDEYYTMLSMKRTAKV